MSALPTLAPLGSTRIVYVPVCVRVGRIAKLAAQELVLEPPPLGLFRNRVKHPIVLFAPLSVIAWPEAPAKEI